MRLNFAIILALAVAGCVSQGTTEQQSSAVSSDKLPDENSQNESTSANAAENEPSADVVLFTDSLAEQVVSPNDGFPVRIRLKEVEAVLATTSPDGAGDGGMTWEGVKCGMYGSGYSMLQTPWHASPQSVTANYAETSSGTFLAEIIIGVQRYRRHSREEDFLTWEGQLESYGGEGYSEEGP